MTNDEKGSVAENTTLVQEIRCAINRLSMERESNTPDYVLAEFLSSSFAAFNAAVNKRETHYGRNKRPGNCKIDDKGAGEGPYDLGDKIFIRGRSNSWELQTKADVELANHAYAEGRKAMEKYAEESINLGRAESIVLNKEIRRLEKLFEEREQEIQDLRFAIGESDKDFKELLELANKLREYPWDEFEAFDAWKKARGIE